MISGDRADTAGSDDAGQRGDPEFGGLPVAHDDQGGGTVVERATVARRDAPVRAEHRLELRHGLIGHARSWPVVG